MATENKILTWHWWQCNWIVSMSTAISHYLLSFHFIGLNAKQIFMICLAALTLTVNYTEGCSEDWTTPHFTPLWRFHFRFDYSIRFELTPYDHDYVVFQTITFNLLPNCLPPKQKMSLKWPTKSIKNLHKKPYSRRTGNGKWFKCLRFTIKCKVEGKK